MTRQDTCPTCGIPTQTRTMPGGRVVTLHAHPELVATTPDTYVVLADGTVMTATHGTVHTYREHTHERART